MHEEIIIAGAGGQGILLIGKLLSLVAMAEKKRTTWFPSYGSAVRGGRATCTVIISSEEIGSPISERPDSLIVMNKPSLKFVGLLKPKGLLIVNRSLADWLSSRKDLQVLEIRATDIAQELGNSRIANLVMLGAYLSKKTIVSLETVCQVLRNEFGQKTTKAILELNEKALLYCSQNPT